MATKDSSDKATVPSEEDGQNREDSRESNRGHRKKKQYSPLHRVEAKAMVPKDVRAHCSIIRLAEQRENFGEQSLADFTNLPLTG